MYRSGLTGVLVVLCVLQGVARGYKSFQDRLPNGDNVPHPCMANIFWHGLGHENPVGGGSRNPFGRAFDDAGKTWTRALCEADSDGDGRSNGVELGDPDCSWTPGTLPPQITGITHPGVCEPMNSTPCVTRNAWVSCENPEFKCDAVNSSDVRNFEMKFPKTPVPGQVTTYICMVSDVPSDQDYHIIANEPMIDNYNVMHHILVYGCGDTPEGTEVPTGPYKCDMGAGYECNDVIAGWTVGSSGICLHEAAGFKIGKNGYKRIAMEFHWNNPFKRTDYFDSSGLKFYYTPNLRPNDMGVMWVGQRYLEIPPREENVVFTGDCTSECTSGIMTEPIYITKAANHMHYLGVSQSLRVYRNGSHAFDLTDEPDYNYDSPKFIKHDPPLKVMPGDSIRSECIFKSTYRNKYTNYGAATHDEMCFGLLWFYPKSALRQPYCVSWKSLALCSRDAGGCEMYPFMQQRTPESRALYEGLSNHCEIVGECRPECLAAISNFTSNTCMQGETGEYIMSYMRYFNAGLKYINMIKNCDPCLYS